MLLSNYVICGKKKSIFIKNKELNNFNENLKWIKSLTSELHLKQPGFTYSACEAFPKHGERIQKFRETGNSKHSYRN